MTLSLRKAEESDIEFLIELRDVSMRPYLVEAGMPTTREAYEHRVRYAFEHAQIIEFHDNRAGLFKAKFDEVRNHWSLLQIQLMPQFQKLDIGTSLLYSLIQKASETDATVGLSVIKSNPALNLYSRVGFKVISQNTAEYKMLHKVVGASEILDQLRSAFRWLEETELSDNRIEACPDIQLSRLVEHKGMLHTLPYYMQWCLHHLDRETENSVFDCTIAALNELSRSESVQSQLTSQQCAVILEFLVWCQNHLYFNQEVNLVRGIRNWRSIVFSDL